MSPLAAKLGVALSSMQLPGEIIAAAELPPLFPMPLNGESQTDVGTLLIG